MVLSWLLGLSRSSGTQQRWNRPEIILLTPAAQEVRWHLAAKNTLEKTVFKAVKPPQSVS